LALGSVELLPHIVGTERWRRPGYAVGEEFLGVFGPGVVEDPGHIAISASGHSHVDPSAGVGRLRDADAVIHGDTLGAVSRDAQPSSTWRATYRAGRTTDPRAASATVSEPSAPMLVTVQLWRLRTELASSVSSRASLRRVATTLPTKALVPSARTTEGLAIRGLRRR
jgi:hypothetical protein